MWPGVSCAGLIPLGYGAYLLFRTPLPSLTAVEPPTRQFENEFRVMVTGENLRPYMRVSLNDMQGRSFLFKSATSAEVVFGDIPPGTYDVVLYDNAQERNRLPERLHAHASGVAAGAARCRGLPDQRHAGTGGADQGRHQVRADRRGDGARQAGTRSGAQSLPATSRSRLPFRRRNGSRRCCASTAMSSRVPAGFGACVAGKVLGPSVYLDLPVATGHTAVPDHRGASRRQAGRGRGSRQAESRSGVSVYSRGRYRRRVFA